LQTQTPSPPPPSKLSRPLFSNKVPPPAPSSTTNVNRKIGRRTSGLVKAKAPLVEESESESEDNEMDCREDCVEELEEEEEVVVAPVPRAARSTVASSSQDRASASSSLRIGPRSSSSIRLLTRVKMEEEDLEERECGELGSTGPLQEVQQAKGIAGKGKGKARASATFTSGRSESNGDHSHTVESVEEEDIRNEYRAPTPQLPLAPPPPLPPPAPKARPRASAARLKTTTGNGRIGSSDVEETNKNAQRTQVVETHPSTLLEEYEPPSSQGSQGDSDGGGRHGRARKSVNYALPKLNTKMRRSEDYVPIIKAGIRVAGGGGKKTISTTTSRPRDSASIAAPRSFARPAPSSLDSTPAASPASTTATPGVSQADIDKVKAEYEERQRKKKEAGGTSTSDDKDKGKDKDKGWLSTGMSGISSLAATTKDLFAPPASAPPSPTLSAAQIAADAKVFILNRDIFSWRQDQKKKSWQAKEAKERAKQLALPSAPRGGLSSGPARA
ncbi:hypothetical protein P7C70_g6227, partial [Phenoliferia sp. Uapishka_3]